MVLYPNKLPESERVCSGICIIRENDLQSSPEELNKYRTKLHPLLSGAPDKNYIRLYRNSIEGPKYQPYFPDYVYDKLL